MAEAVSAHHRAACTCFCLPCLQVQSSKDPEGLRVFYYLVQVGVGETIGTGGKTGGWMGGRVGPGASVRQASGRQ